MSDAIAETAERLIATEGGYSFLFNVKSVEVAERLHAAIQCCPGIPAPARIQSGIYEGKIFLLEVLIPRSHALEMAKWLQGNKFTKFDGLIAWTFGYPKEVAVALEKRLRWEDVVKP